MQETLNYKKQMEDAGEEVGGGGAEHLGDGY